MLTAVFLILAIAAVALHLIRTYVVPMFAEKPVSFFTLFCGLVALAAIIWAILVWLGALPPGHLAGTGAGT